MWLVYTTAEWLLKMLLFAMWFQSGSVTKALHTDFNVEEPMRNTTLASTTSYIKYFLTYQCLFFSVTVPSS